MYLISNFPFFQLSPINILKFASMLLLLGRGLEHLLWDAPYREILWNEKIVTPVLNAFAVSWREWAYQSDRYIILLTKLMGAAYIMSAACLYLFSKKAKLQMGILLFSGLGLFIFSFLFYLSKLSKGGAFIEMTLQWITPLALLWALQNKSKIFLEIILRISLSLVFIGHALYAIGYYQVPSNFATMVITLTPISQYSDALVFLKIAGFLDIMASIFLFWPKAGKLALVYMLVWGFLTALARPLSFVEFAILENSLREWIPAFLVRTPHFLIPWFLLLLSKNTGDKSRFA